MPCLANFKIESQAKWNISGNSIWCSSSLHTERSSIIGKYGTCSERIGAPGFMFWWLWQGPQWCPWSHSTFPTCNEVQIEKRKIPGRFLTSDFRIKWISFLCRIVFMEILWYGDMQILRMMCFCSPTCHQRWKHQIAHHETSRRQWNRLRTWSSSREAMVNHWINCPFVVDWKEV